jgi:hypothetical protein
MRLRFVKSAVVVIAINFLFLSDISMIGLFSKIEITSTETVAHTHHFDADTNALGIMFAIFYGDC